VQQALWLTPLCCWVIVTRKHVWALTKSKDAELVHKFESN